MPAGGPGDMVKVDIAASLGSHLLNNPKLTPRDIVRHVFQCADDANLAQEYAQTQSGTSLDVFMDDYWRVVRFLRLSA